MNIFRFLHHFLVPHAGNNHRARALHHEALLTYVLVFGVLNLSIKVVNRQAPDVLGYATDIRVERLLEDTNGERAKLGLSSLTLNATLSQAAEAKAHDMFTNGYWAHTSPQGKTPWDFILASGYRYALAGENLAKNFQTSDGVVSAWMASPSHRANIAKSGYTDIGFAIVNGVLNGEETTLVVQMFGSQSQAAAPVAKVEAAAPKVVAEQPVTTIEPTIAVNPSTQAAVAAATAPRINVPTLTHQTVYLFMGLLIGVLFVDAYVVSRKKVVRLAGHNIAHILFLLTIFLGGMTIARGALI